MTTGWVNYELMTTGWELWAELLGAGGVSLGVCEPAPGVGDH